MIYEKKPEDFNPKFEVAVSKIYVGRKALFVLRSMDEECPNTWSLPGGKIEQGESKEDAIAREIAEETGIKSKPVFIKTIFVRYPDKDFLYHMFKTELKTFPEIQLNPEHTEYRWLTTVEALKLELIPGEDECLRLFDSSA
jgi:8-oxo-dGTP pyrophosphatase MutT (NUDIX family)